MLVYLHATLGDAYGLAQEVNMYGDALMAWGDPYFQLEHQTATFNALLAIGHISLRSRVKARWIVNIVVDEFLGGLWAFASFLVLVLPIVSVPMAIVLTTLLSGRLTACYSLAMVYGRVLFLARTPLIIGGFSTLAAFIVFWAS
jgi:hypothetical protein